MTLRRRSALLLACLVSTIALGCGGSTPPPEAKAPAPAPAPAAAQIVRSFQVFFDFDKSNIRPDARPIIEEAANNARKGGASRINLTGHTDRAGSDAYNQRLSVRRAEAVKNYMVSKGIPANRIYTEGKGKAQPVKDCKDTNRKALIACLQPNRRVEVEIVGTRSR